MLGGGTIGAGNKYAAWRDWPVRELFAYQILHRLLPFGALACFASAVVIPIAYPKMVVLQSAFVGTLGLFFLWLRYFWLEKIETVEQLDRTSSAVFLGAAASAAIGAATNANDSPVSAALLSLAGAPIFVSHTPYVVSVAFIVVSQLAARSFGGFAIDTPYVFLAILGPTYSFLVRAGVAHLQRRVLSQRQSLVRNIDELEREKKLREDSEQKLGQAHKMEGLGLMAAGVAHDFNNHLQAISSIAQTIPTSDDPVSAAAKIRRATRDAAEICRGMLDYAGKRQTSLDRVDLSELLLSTEPLLAAAVAGTATLTIDVEPGEHTTIAERAALQQGLTNLVRNAFESRPGGDAAIAIRAFSGAVDPDRPGWREFGSTEEAERELCVVIEVSDTGAGMDEATLERCFDPYFTTKGQGHGFGLATTLGNVRRAGGFMRCKTAPGEGAVMQIVLPRAAPEKARARAQAQADPVFPPALGSVLVVDDESAVLEAVSELLAVVGCDVTSAASGDDALAKIDAGAGPFDLLVLDYAMPGMNGVELLERVRARGVRSKAVVTTGFADDSIVGRSGIVPDAVLPKPYELVDLFKVFQEIETA